MVQAQHGVPEQPDSLTFTGKIAADGTTTLTARGKTGEPKFSATRQPAGTPYGYRMDVRFDGSRGSGSRTEPRPCTLTFVK